MLICTKSMKMNASIGLKTLLHAIVTKVKIIVAYKRRDVSSLMIQWNTIGPELSGQLLSLGPGSSDPVLHLQHVAFTSGLNCLFPTLASISTFQPVKKKGKGRAQSFPKFKGMNLVLFISFCSHSPG